MNIVKIKGIELGKGSPKICVPVTGRTKEEIRLRLEELQEAEPDLAEWRADWYEGVFDREKLEDELAFLRRELGNMPLLVTFRTKEEGGEQEISREAYEKFLRQVISSLRWPYYNRKGKEILLELQQIRISVEKNRKFPAAAIRRRHGRPSQAGQTSGIVKLVGAAAVRVQKKPAAAFLL